jgi:nucleotide-binding universal stress UspA family protein
MYRKILVPLDGSSFSECSIDHVKAVATGCNVPEVVLLSVIEPLHQPIYGVDDEWLREMRAQASAAAKKNLESLADSLKKDGVAASSDIVEGDAASKILDYAENNGVDLIVMSTHGRSGPSRWAFGSVTDKVLKTSTIPILVATPPGCRISL